MLVASALVAPTNAFAQDFAEPPERHPRSQVAVATDVDADDYDLPEDRSPSPAEPSMVRILAGPALKADADAAAPGLLTAIEIGRGPAGFRLSGAWMGVGNQKGVSQYTGELTLDFGGRSRIRPVIGAGGGVARVSPEDGATSTVGVGLVRAGLGVRLPFSDTDARAALDVSGVLPAIKGSGAEDVSPWVVTSLSVAIGF